MRLASHPKSQNFGHRGKLGQWLGPGAVWPGWRCSLNGIECDSYRKAYHRNYRLLRQVTWWVFLPPPRVQESREGESAGRGSQNTMQAFEHILKSGKDSRSSEDSETWSEKGWKESDRQLERESGVSELEGEWSRELQKGRYRNEKLQKWPLTSIRNDLQAWR